MTIATVNDPLIAPSRGTAQQAIGFGKASGALAPYVDYVNEVYRIAPLLNLDALLVVAQSSEETDHWTSSWWASRRNPAGLGITGDAAQDAASQTFASGADAARGQIAHMLAYVGDGAHTGDNGATEALLGIPQILTLYDKRWSSVANAGLWGTVKKLADLSGKWATDPQYAVSIAAHANGILAMPTPAPAPTPGGPPVSTLNMTKDLIPLPDGIITKIITDAENTAWDVLGQKEVWAFVLHRQLGTNDGTDQYFRTMANAHTTGAGGLTEFGQRATGGELFLWNSPGGFGGDGVTANRAPWASGRFNVHGDSYGDGLAFEQKYGVNAINGKAAA